PSDIAIDRVGLTHELNDYRNNLIPENARITQIWIDSYKIIFNCNVVLDRIDDERIQFADEKERLQYKGEALFLRGYMYRLLGILYGGVPVVTREITSPKRDFVRASREEVWAQVINDYSLAEQYLPIQSDLREDGRLTKAAAQHALAEIYIITKEWDKAIASASAVIDNPEYSLITQRFGTWKDKPGDFYSDLFRRGNVNYIGQSGTNTEAIWVDQFEYLATGGGHINSITRFLGPSYYSIKGNDGNNLFIGPTNQNGGRGIGWLVPTDYMLNQVWSDPNDVRNSQYNIIRDIKADNPKSSYYGQFIVASGSFTNYSNPLGRFWSAIFTKTTPINDFPEEVILDRETGVVSSFANQTFNDSYHFRLAETYLLRAEAFLGKGDKVSAAQDINVLRGRAQATPVEASAVDINYILDERARELCWEEKRVLTLMRLGLHKERVDQFNVMSSGHIADHNNLWPIPQSEIERNTDAVLEQNPGYN
ncbi:MAG: RagB/SusD family nutrient uptake outer membrane protein, partial [Bacteroidales bacterium]|nr:RagB/SusD family nutrient uptake outer membrane protein [Bacteroidales bacterium]